MDWHFAVWVSVAIFCVVTRLRFLLPHHSHIIHAAYTGGNTDRVFSPRRVFWPQTVTTPATSTTTFWCGGLNGKPSHVMALKKQMTGWGGRVEGISSRVQGFGWLQPSSSCSSMEIAAVSWISPNWWTSEYSSARLAYIEYYLLKTSPRPVLSTRWMTGLRRSTTHCWVPWVDDERTMIWL